MPKPNFLSQALLSGILLSIVLHGFLLLIFSDFLASTATTLPKGAAAKIEVILSPVAVGAASLDDSVGIPRSPSIKPRLQTPAASKTTEAPVKVPPIAGVVAEMPSAASIFPEQLGLQRGLDSAGPQPTAPAPEISILSQDGLREYRLNLGREARRYKRYPSIARARGLEGVAVIVVSTTAGIAVPQVSLSHTSGHQVLDTQALEMATLAVRFANLPESLRGRDFALDLPIRFSLDE